MRPDHRPPPVAYGFLAIAITLWGTSYWPTEIAGEQASPLALAALRSFPAALVLLVFLPVLRARLPRGRTLVGAGLTGLLMVGVFFYGLTEGTIKAGAGNAAVLANTSPFFVLFLGWAFANERLSRRGGTGLVVGFAGVVLVVSSQLGGGEGNDLALGLALALAASVAWALGTLLVKAMVGREPDLDLVGFTAAQYAAGGTALAVAAFIWSGTDEVSWGSESLWIPLVYLILGNSAIGSIAYFAALKRLSATKTAAGQFLVPVVAVIVDIVRGSAPDAVVLCGMVLTILGVALVNLPPRRTAADAASAEGPDATPAAVVGPARAPGRDG
jgi:drug/metabolite transporter (DMT)-like permease